MVYEQAHNIKFVCIDVANGYSERFTDFVREFRALYPNIVIIAGNVVTADPNTGVNFKWSRHC